MMTEASTLDLGAARHLGNNVDRLCPRKPNNELRHEELGIEHTPSISPLLCNAPGPPAADTRLAGVPPKPFGPAGPEGDEGPPLPAPALLPLRVMALFTLRYTAVTRRLPQPRPVEVPSRRGRKRPSDLLLGADSQCEELIDSRGLPLTARFEITSPSIPGVCRVRCGAPREYGGHPPLEFLPVDLLLQ